jgi:transposase
LKSRRDEDAFAREQDNQKALQSLADAGLVDLFYCDGSGFCSVPSVPYAWQPVGTVIELPAFPSKRLNVLGFLSRDNRAFFHSVPGQVAEAIDRFAAWRGNAKPCVVVLDNAPRHARRSIRERLDDWAAQGIVLHYLPTYSPELNLIERLWRKIKYDWLPLSGYESFANLVKAVLAVLDVVGHEYQITCV